MAKDREKIAWLPGLATALAIVSCYGTTLLIGALSALGISVAINERAWAGAISVFAGLAAILIWASGRRRRVFGPTLLAAAGLGFVLWAMYGTYSRVVEVAGFALLVAATLWDARSRSTAQEVQRNVGWVEPPDLASRLDRDPKPLVLDVRGADEFMGELGHIRGARNIPSSEMPSRLAELTPFQASEVVLVCKTQMRSAKAAELLREAGFGRVAVLRGGMVEWARQGRPVDPAPSARQGALP